MSIYHRKINGYYVTRFNYHLMDWYEHQKRKNQLQSQAPRLEPAAAAAAEEPSETVTIVFNDTPGQEMTVPRSKLAKSCRYFQVLLQGQFTESKMTRINLTNQGFSFTAFKAAIRYAVGEPFHDGTDKMKDTYNLKVFEEIIQLAHYWGCDDLIKEAEGYLMKFADRENILLIMALAEDLALHSLKKSCSEFACRLDVRSKRPPLIRCAKVGHERHTYNRCPTRASKNGY